MNILFYKYIYTLPSKVATVSNEGFDSFKKLKECIRIAPDSKSGYLGTTVLTKNTLVIQSLSLVKPSYPENEYLDTDVKYLHFYDYLIERTRILFQIIIYNIIQHNKVYIQYGPNFDTFFLKFLIRAPYPLYGDMSDIIDQEEMSVDEYVKRGYYDLSMERINQTSLMSEEQAEEVIDRWNPVTTGGDILEMLPYLYPVNILKNQEYIVKDNTRLWYCLYSFGLWYKEKIKIGKIYESIEEENLPDLEIFLRGEDKKESIIRDKVYDLLECKNEEEFSEKLVQIQDFYKKVADNLKKE